MKQRKKVLFLCTHNSARSQIAEGLMNARFSHHFEAESAGILPTRVHPLAIRVMGEIGIDLSPKRSKHLKDVQNREFDYIVTVCDRAKESCPFFPGGKQYLHKNFPDPDTFKGSEEEQVEKFRQLRDQVLGWMTTTFTEKETYKTI